MIRVQYFANFAGDVAFTMSYIKNLHGTPSFLGFWDLKDFKQTLNFNYFYFRVSGHLSTPEVQSSIHVMYLHKL